MGEYVDETFEEMMERTEQEARLAEEGGGGSESPRESTESRRQRFSVVMDTCDASGVKAKFSMCDRSKNSVVLANTIECFADFEPPWDSDMTAQLFEEALVNLTREEGDGLSASVVKFRRRFSKGPTIKHATSRYLIVGDEPTDATLIHVCDVRVAAAVDDVKRALWDEFLQREGKSDGAEATCLHRIAEDELIYRVVRTPPRGAKPEELVCHHRYVERYDPVDRLITMAYSVACEGAPETPDCTRLTVPLAGFVVDGPSEAQQGEADAGAGAAATTRVTWVREQNLVIGHEHAIMKTNARKLSDIQERLCPGSTTGDFDDDDDDGGANAAAAAAAPRHAAQDAALDGDDDDDEAIPAEDQHPTTAFCCSFDSSLSSLLGLNGGGKSSC